MSHGVQLSGNEMLKKRTTFAKVIVKIEVALFCLGHGVVYQCTVGFVSVENGWSYGSASQSTVPAQLPTESMCNAGKLTFL